GLAFEAIGDHAESPAGTVVERAAHKLLGEAVDFLALVLVLRIDAVQFQAQRIGENLLTRPATRIARDALLERHCFNTLPYWRDRIFRDRLRACGRRADLLIPVPRRTSRRDHSCSPCRRRSCSLRHGSRPCGRLCRACRWSLGPLPAGAGR